MNQASNHHVMDGPVSSSKALCVCAVALVACVAGCASNVPPFAFDALSTRRTIIAVDIDHTVCQTNYISVVLSPTRDGGSRPMDRAAEVLQRVAQRCDIIYLTGRPDWLFAKTRRWLSEHDFPPGPLIGTRGFLEFARMDAFKAITVRRLRTARPNLLISIGDTPGDVAAYRASGLCTLVLRPGGPPADAADEASAFDAPHYVQNWDAIDAFFREHQGVVASPRRLAEALHGDVATSQLLAWRAPGPSYGPGSGLLVGLPGGVGKGPQVRPTENAGVVPVGPGDRDGVVADR